MAIYKELLNYGGHFDSDNKEKRIIELEKIMSSDNFWNDKSNSEKTIEELNYLKGILSNVSELKNIISDSIVLIDELKKNYDDEIKKLVELEINDIGEKLGDLEVKVLLSGPYDKGDAILEIHSGAGGTEACDWAMMLYRMYLRFCENKNYKCEIIDLQDGDTAGIKSASIIVRGINAYGYLKNEKGVHRLIRISPFDSNSRRHTSFASIDVTPVFDNSEINIEIKDADIRIDVYRSSGKGGQGVNTTDSAVRITHLPTKTVVTCQNERSQIQNKEKALEVLKNKLYQLEVEKRDNLLKNMKSSIDINFGSQIRSYIMHPYSMVKDHRTNTENTNVLKVLDGDLDKFINDNLKFLNKD
ncbi:MAG TPA: peptide chain release factor 2 [Tenericutes bacterium]|nr:peptide chain release factor 2 [Mycoplasmatota bacterium]